MRTAEMVSFAHLAAAICHQWLPRISHRGRLDRAFTTLPPSSLEYAPPSRSPIGGPFLLLLLAGGKRYMPLCCALLSPRTQFEKVLSLVSPRASASVPSTSAMTGRLDALLALP